MIWAAIPAAMQAAGGVMGGLGGVGSTSAGGLMGGLMNGPGTSGSEMTSYGGRPSPGVNTQFTEEEEPTRPNAPYQGGDVSGFANYGMTPPALPNPREGYGGLMALSQLMDPHRGQTQDPFQQQQPGGLMAYLQALSRS